MDDAQKSNASPPDPLAFAAGVLDALRGLCVSLIGQKHLSLDDAQAMARHFRRAADVHHRHGNSDRALPLNMLGDAITNMVATKQKIDREIVAYCIPERPGVRIQ
ncbi:MAG: hypothetical protein U1E81_08170 [Xanthobacteraceae bacterium]